MSVKRCSWIRVEVPVNFADITGTTACVVCSQSPVLRKIVRGSSGYWYGGHLGFICTEGVGVGVKGVGKIEIRYSRFLPNFPPSP